MPDKKRRLRQSNVNYYANLAGMSRLCAIFAVLGLRVAGRCDVVLWRWNADKVFTPDEVLMGFTGSQDIELCSLHQYFRDSWARIVVG